MHRIFTTIRAAMQRLAERDVPSDPLDSLPPHLLADLPPFHPRFDRPAPERVHRRFIGNR